MDLEVEFDWAPGSFVALNREPHMLANGNGCGLKWTLDGAQLMLTGDVTGETQWPETDST